MASEAPPFRTNRTRQSPENWPEWGARFLEVLRKTRCVVDACEAIDVARSWVYDCRPKYPEFAKAWDDVAAGTVDKIEASGQNLAIDGLEETIFGSEDQEIGKKKKVFPGLIQFFLQALRPEKYRPRHDDVDDNEKAVAIAREMANLVQQMRDTVPKEPPPAEPPAAVPETPST